MNQIVTRFDYGTAFAVNDSDIFAIKRPFDTSAKQKRIAILFSGRGSNMKSLAEFLQRKNIPAELALTICNRPDAGGIEYAKTLSAPCEIIDHTKFSSRETFEAAMQKHLKAHDIDIICAAGFMRLLTPSFVKQWENKIINIHPSLLPKHKGLNTHAAALAAGDTEHGCSVHYMTAQMDSGEIITQKKLKVKADDTADTLAARVLQLEHSAYAQALTKILSDTRTAAPTNSLRKNIKNIIAASRRKVINAAQNLSLF